MAKLASEYIDMKKIAHRVEHFTLPIDDEMDREGIVYELIYALTKAYNH